MSPITLPPPISPLVPKPTTGPLPVTSSPAGPAPASSPVPASSSRAKPQGAKDAVMSLLGMSARDALTAAQKHITTVQGMTFDGTPEANTKSAMGAVAALTETSLLLQQGHRTIGDVAPISKELEANLMLGATQVAAAGPSLIAAVSSGSSRQVSGKLTQLLGSVSTTIGAALDVITRSAVTDRTTPPAGYL